MSELSDAVHKEVEKRLNGVEAEASKRFDDLARSLELQLKDKAERISKSIGVQFVLLAATAMSVVIGGAGLTLYTSMREVNGQVIALQDRLMEAQETIRRADDELGAKADELERARAELDRVREQLETQRTQPQARSGVGNR